MLSLVVAFFVCTEMEGQNDYAYRKGKSYANVPATRLPDAIDLSAELQSLVYQNAVPEGVHTLACPLFLPKYVRGVFLAVIRGWAITNGLITLTVYYLGAFPNLRS